MGGEHGASGRLRTDLFVHVEREAREVDLVRVGGREVEKLAERGLQRHLVEKLQERHVKGLAAKVTLEDLVDLSFEDDPIVDRVHLHVVELVPARLSAPRLRLVHDVVRHQEERLQPLDAPAEDGGASVLLVGKLAAGR